MLPQYSRTAPTSYSRDVSKPMIPLTDPRSYSSLNTYFTQPNDISPDGLWTGFYSPTQPTWSMDPDQLRRHYQAWSPWKGYASTILGGSLASGLGAGAGGGSGAISEIPPSAYAPISPGSLGGGAGAIGGGVGGGIGAAGGVGGGTVGGGGAISEIPASAYSPLARSGSLGGSMGNLVGPPVSRAGSDSGGFLSNIFGGNSSDWLTNIGLLGSLLGNKKKNVTETSTSEPPSYLQGPLQGAVGDALKNYGAGGQDIYPYLDQAFNRAADLTKTRLDTEFAGAGRNLGASYPARSDELQTLASSIYSPNNLYQFDPLQQLLDRLTQLLPGSGGTTTNRYPVFKTGLI